MFLTVTIVISACPEATVTEVLAADQAETAALMKTTRPPTFLRRPFKLF
jgi:hypothetical protein